MKKRVVAVFTGNRAEYGLQYPILKAIQANDRLEYRLIASGAHLDPNFGQTLREIQDDGFEIHAEVKIDLQADNLFSTAQAIGSGVMSVSHALAKIQPDLFVVYADRFEGFAAVIAGTQMNIPTAHVEGGDLTEGGALDDSVRHAMSKLAHLHFTTNEQATNRVLAMGEEAWRVHTVGFPAIDLIEQGNLATAPEIESRFTVDTNRPLVIFTQHSVTTEFDQAVAQVRPSLDALQMLAEKGVQVLVTYPNNDAGGRAIIGEIEARFGSNKIPNIHVTRSMGRYNYHGALGLARDVNKRIVCAGNSSSGIKETPALQCPTVNIGARQLGRLRATNVIDAGYNSNEIYLAIERCLYDGSFREVCRTCHNPYGVGDAGKKIAEVLASVNIGPELIRKRMTLLGEQQNGWYR
jgi:UDP-hydrolysing UDP-N-acetyl-D-glucosamine 2-epimerase